MLLPQLLDVLDHVLDSWQYDPFRYVGQAVAPQPQEVNYEAVLDRPIGLDLCDQCQLRHCPSPELLPDLRHGHDLRKALANQPVKFSLSPFSVIIN